MTDESRPDPFLVADHPGLDFLNSTCAPWGEPIEWIADGADLLAWMEAAGLLSAPEAAHLREAHHGEALDAAAAEARALREWFRGFVLARQGAPLDASALEDLSGLNRILERDRSWRGIAAEGGALRWTHARRWDRAQDALLPLAEAMGDLVCEADFALVRQCEGPSCTMQFLDTSKNRRRRWCSMAVCGNRAKAAAFRARKGKGG